MRVERKNGGFTLLEMAVVLGVLGVLLLVVGTLMTGTMDAYAKVSRETETIKQARRGLEMISRDIRECVANNSRISNRAEEDPDPRVNAYDTIMIVSARGYDPDTDTDNVFGLTREGLPEPQSIILYYTNTTAEGISQLIRLRLDFRQDLVVYEPPFRLAAVLTPGPYVGGNIFLFDDFDTRIAINRNTGNVGVTAPFKPPLVLINGCTSLDAIAPADMDLVEVRLTVQFADRNGRTATTRMATRIDPRNSL
jgi:prepilin-type N-terminal cleavage/methylation domain-containing protein